MKLSVVIVNYNVKHFLEQCLHSVQNALKGIESEILVVDNNSVDGSCMMVEEKFPGVRLIQNKTNTGFSYANNQAIKISRGEYVLLLNPDTLVEEDTFKKIIKYMDSHPDAGALGVKMIDGKGNFLPESKRGLPTPMVAFYKIFGFSRLFPHSKTFNRYHLGYLDNEEVHQVEILSGAFMFIRKLALEKSGLLDESFFMYGEDIDLSYRILKSGYKNIYYPETTIIHYKGESTKKGSINYVLVFYRAMAIFARKHFSKKNADTFSLLINIAIYFRATLSIIKRFLMAMALPILDAMFIYLGYYFFLPVWEQYKFRTGGSFPEEFSHIVIPLYIFFWISSIFFSGGYSRHVSLRRLYRGLGVGTIIILLIYSLLSESYRFSRALILMGAGWAFLSSNFIRFLLHLTGNERFRIKISKKKRIVIVGTEKEAKRVYDILSQVSTKSELVGLVCPGDRTEENKTSKSTEEATVMGSLSQLREIVKINSINEIIFCSKEISSGEIIQQMLLLSDDDVHFKIAPPESLSIIGSSSIHTPGDLYTLEINSIAKESNKRFKRLADITLSITFAIIFPILVFFVKKPLRMLKNCFFVIIGYYTWVGYYQSPKSSNFNLPSLKPGILNPLDALQVRKKINIDPGKYNMLYAKDYTLFTDVMIVFRNIKFLGRRV